MEIKTNQTVLEMSPEPLDHERLEEVISYWKDVYDNPHPKEIDGGEVLKAFKEIYSFYDHDAPEPENIFLCESLYSFHKIYQRVLWTYNVRILNSFMSAFREKGNDIGMYNISRVEAFRIISEPLEEYHRDVSLTNNENIHKYNMKEIEENRMDSFCPYSYISETKSTCPTCNQSVILKNTAKLEHPMRTYLVLQQNVNLLAVWETYPDLFPQYQGYVDLIKKAHVGGFAFFKECAIVFKPFTVKRTEKIVEYPSGEKVYLD